jgi:predicted nucleic acid-binding protein
MRLVIADTSCFILFKKINRFDILQNTFSEISVTDKVLEEYGPLPKWIVVRSDYNQEIFKKINQNFGAGESSCIALAQEESDPILLIDDRRARKLAEDLGIQCTGSLGVLLIAKREGVIDSVKNILEEITKTDFRLTDSITRRILELAKEL